MVNAVQMGQIFPPKNLEKIRAPKIRMRQFLIFLQLYGNCRSDGSNFPAKKLRKNTGAQNTHAPIFFLIFQAFMFNFYY